MSGRFAAEIEALERLLAAAREAQALADAADRAAAAYREERNSCGLGGANAAPALRLVAPVPTGRMGAPRLPLSDDERVNRRREAGRIRQARYAAKKGGAS
jgi:hypothetical protein